MLVYVEKIIVKLFYYALSEKKDSTTSVEVEEEKSKKRWVAWKDEKEQQQPGRV